MNLLIVSGFPMMAQIISGFVSELRLGAVDIAPDSATAWAKIATGQYALVLCDWELRPHTGLELLRVVRTNRLLARLPFILMFADSSHEKTAIVRQAGGGVCLVKPFDKYSMRAAIEQALVLSAQA